MKRLLFIGFAASHWHLAWPQQCPSRRPALSALLMERLSRSRAAMVVAAAMGGGHHGGRGHHYGWARGRGYHYGCAEQLRQRLGEVAGRDTLQVIGNSVSIDFDRRM
jgi:hypothetical protein